MIRLLKKLWVSNKKLIGITNFRSECDCDNSYVSSFYKYYEWFRSYHVLTLKIFTNVVIIIVDNNGHEITVVYIHYSMVQISYISQFSN